MRKVNVARCALPVKVPPGGSLDLPLALHAGRLDRVYGCLVKDPVHLAWYSPLVVIGERSCLRDRGRAWPVEVTRGPARLKARCRWAARTVFEARTSASPPEPGILGQRYEFSFPLPICTNLTFPPSSPQFLLRCCSHPQLHLHNH